MAPEPEIDFCSAVGRYDKEAIRRIIETGGIEDIDAPAKPGGESALWLAILKEDFEFASWLISKGAKVGSLWTDSETRAWWMAFDPAIARFLFAHGLDPKGRSPSGEPIGCSIVRVWVADPSIDGGVELRARLETLSICQKAGVGWNERHRGDAGRTPLHYAVEDYGRTEAAPAIISTLVEFGAFGDIPRYDGVTPVHVAADDEHGSYETMEALLRGDVSMNMEHSGGWTPLHIAANFGNVRKVSLLLARGAIADGSPLCRFTPLAWMCYNPQLGVKPEDLVKTAQVLIAAGADPRSKVWLDHEERAIALPELVVRECASHLPPALVSQFEGYV